MRLIILARDGVINHELPGQVCSPEQWRAIDGSLQAIADLTRIGYEVVVITNQEGIAGGLYSINTLNVIHRRMLAELQPLGGEISAIFFCPHAPADNCDCRKPRSGLFDEVARRLQCPLKGVYAVGHTLRDVQAALQAGATPVLVQTGNGGQSMPGIQRSVDAGELPPVATYPDLAAFVAQLPSEKEG